MNNDFIQHVKTIGRGLPVWAQMAARVPFLFLFAYETYFSWHERKLKNQSSKCYSVSIIIPTLNEAENILPCIKSAYKNRYVYEIIVVDAGSKDQTATLARLAGARVIVHEKPIEKGGGRGGQIKTGINEARGDVIAILHADTRLPGMEIDRMIEALARHPSAVGGSIGCRFDSSKFKFRLIELANDFRVAFLKISFGDQVQFFRRQPVVDYDLFPDIPLMEDVELSIRLHRLGRQIYLFGSAMVSTRRWENVGVLNALWVLRHVFEYLIRRLWKASNTADLYKKYYFHV
jgi:glycosyltransferase involved in cell wall biosynthesis